MRAAVMRQGALVVDEVADPKPGVGQVLVRTVACGICGSDLHFLKSGGLTAAAPLVQFEAIGVPGILNDIMRRAPRGSRITVVGVCMEADSIQPIFGINKELQLQFVLGYTADEFAATLGHLAEGRIDGAPLITGRVGLDGVAQAFLDLANPDRHAKILVMP